MRTIGVVTVARSDYGIYRPILREIAAHADLRLHLIASGTHLSGEFGMTINSIEADGFVVHDRVEMLLSSDSPEAIAKSMGLALMGFSSVYAGRRLDLLLVLGDRFEMHAAALAAVPFKIPLAHIHGGELTAGALDDAFRHSLTKLSHLHFVTTKAYGDRVMQMGEEPWRVTVSGAPSLDNIAGSNRLTAAGLLARFGVRVDSETLLVTYHPPTLDAEDVEQQVDALIAALKASGRPVLVTMPNADTGGRIIRARLEQYVGTDSRAQAVENLGTDGYFSVLSMCAAMVGNSSSGLLEAPSFALPVVNVGIRQAGRIRGRNVLDVGTRTEDILAGLARALDPAFKLSLRGADNPYGDGQASKRIVHRLRNVPLGPPLLLKRFHTPADERHEAEAAR